MNSTLQPAVLRWARERARLEPSELADKLGGNLTVDRVAEWEKNGVIALNVVRRLAQVTHTPEGFLFLAEPQEDRLPIPDFRTVEGSRPSRPSPELLETVYLMQQRQAWMRDFLVEKGEAPLPFVKSFRVGEAPSLVAADIRRVLGFEKGWAGQEKTWTDALRHLRQRIEEAGILMMANGVLGNNTSRKLIPAEFRGFALVDEFAPLIFLNISDSKAAQMFTLAHELAHVWSGTEGVSDIKVGFDENLEGVEKWCNSVAAEFLIPSGEMKDCWQEVKDAKEPFQAVARRFKVSPLVAARRARELEYVTRSEFVTFCQDYAEDERRQVDTQESGGGDFWATQNVRVGRRFGSAVIASAREGRTNYREAYELVGVSGKTFDSFAEKLGFRPR